jgi:2-amino-4-hydroxy-6-hydroxymethyldihydropteridine diphosphokinase
MLYLSLGTNLGDRRANLSRALEGLEGTGMMTITAVSPIYETRPWGPIQEQPNFYNLCLAGTTPHPPLDFLSASKALEEAIGRVDNTRWGPRLIDIDLLLYDELQLTTPRLTLPHPQLHQRAFVLAPLADIAPELHHPTTGQTIQTLLNALPPAEVATVHLLP